MFNRYNLSMTTLIFKSVCHALFLSNIDYYFDTRRREGNFKNQNKTDKLSLYYLSTLAAHEIWPGKYFSKIYVYFWKKLD